jgi:hypothetical protein
MRLTLPQLLEWAIYRDRCLIDRQVIVFDVLNDAIRALGGGEEAGRPLRVRDDLLAKLRSAELVAYGIRPGRFVHEAIPPVHWVAIDSLNALPNALGPNDVGKMYDVIYVDVFVESDSVYALWPGSNPTENYRTGAPGRPSTIQFVEAEWRRRRDAGKALGSLKEEANALHEWCRGAHPAMVAPMPATIANRIREEYRSSRNNPHN